MATELGQAFIQIMPSAKGISGSIQKAINPEATAAGKSAGNRIASSISDSIGKAGSTLTKAITLPVAGAATAITGLVGALGFKRLVGLDTAQAKLKGLGYEAEAVERISSQVTTAIQDGMTTMGEGVDVAAGALAAGVKEGAELERFIKLVGDAAVGANRPVSDMAQIFNRVQGGGELMRNELDMIEHGMPGFEAAMTEHLGVGSINAFRDMVSAGEVGSGDFLDVMEGFAGGMAEAYSESWAGMAQNTFAYVGMIGEAILSGLFEDGKSGLADFIEVLQSPELLEWATETGEKLREVFETLVESVQNAIQWWTGLDDGTKNLIATLAGIVVVVGPILMIVGKLIAIVVTVSKWFALLKTAAMVVGGAIGAISAPVLIAIAAIAAIIGIGISLYKNWDTVKAKASQLGQWLSNIWGNIKQAVSNSMNAVKTAISIGLNKAFSTVTDFFGKFKNAGKNIVSSIAEGITGAIGMVMDAIGGVVSKVRDFLPFSPAKVGPLKDLDKLNFGGTISMGIDDGASEVQRAMDSMLSTPMNATPYNANVGGLGTSNDIMAKFDQLINAVGQNRDLIIDGKTFARVTGDYTSEEGGNRVRRVERGLA